MDDNTLIDRAIEGDKQALEQLLERYQHWIFNISLSFVAHRDDALDITQEVLIKIVTKLHTFRQESSFKT